MAQAGMELSPGTGGVTEELALAFRVFVLVKYNLQVLPYGRSLSSSQCTTIRFSTAVEAGMLRDSLDASRP